MLLHRDLIRAVPWPKDIRFDCSPIQLGLAGSPWHVAVASIMLCRARRNAYVIADAFDRWPTPQLMEVSDVTLEKVLRPLGLQRQRARSIQQLSRKWFLDTWTDLKELKGVGSYVADAVGLFCFGQKELESSDSVLKAYAEQYKGPGVWSTGALHIAGRRSFLDANEAYAHYRSLKDVQAAD